MDDARPDIAGTSAEQRYRFVVREVEARLGREVVASYVHTKNFGLGGLAPAQLVATEEGTRPVLAEISAQADGVPL